MQSNINNIRFEFNNNIIRLHWQMSAKNGSLLWKHKTLVIRIYIDPFEKIALTDPTLHHMNAAQHEVNHGVETSVDFGLSVTGTRSETKRAFRPSGRYNSQIYGSWYEIEIDVNYEKIAESADGILPFLEWDLPINADFTIETEMGHFEKKDFISDTEVIRYNHSPQQIDEYLKQLKHYVQEYLDWQIISPLDIGGSSQRQKPMMNLRFSPRLAEHLKDAPFDSFEKVFEQLENRVLLLGEPGAGKTITALLLTEQAIKNRDLNPNEPLPFYARIPDWIKEQLPLHDWLAQIISLPSNVIKQYIESGDCLLILDGLDELGSERYEEDENGQQRRFDPRKRFLNLVNDLPRKNQLLMTCRIEDYNQIDVEVESVRGKVTLKRLVDSQIRDYLNSTESIKQLWEALQAQPELLDVARTPLMLSLFAFSFRDLPKQIRELKDLSKVEMRDFIFEQYITRRFRHEAERFIIRGTEPPISLVVVKFGLGYVATLDAGNRTFREWHDSVLGANIDTTYVKPEFIDFAVTLHLGTHLEKKQGFRFIHQLLRDYLIFQYCVPILNNVDFEDEYRLHVIEAASRLHDPRLVKPILKNLRHPDEVVRRLAKNALISMRRHAWKPLIDALQTEHNDVRIHIISILPEIGNRSAIPPLVELLRDNEIGGYAFAELLKHPSWARDYLLTHLTHRVYQNDVNYPNE